MRSIWQRFLRRSRRRDHAVAANGRREGRGRASVVVGEGSGQVKANLSKSCRRLATASKSARKPAASDVQAIAPRRQSNAGNGQSKKRGPLFKKQERAALIHELSTKPQLFIVGSQVYRQQLAAAGGNDAMADASISFLLKMVDEMNHRDPLEEMLVLQALWTHMRVAHLSALCCHQTNLEPMQTLHEITDRASNTFRKLMLALAEYRNPRQADSFVAIRQANVAQQQLVQNIQDGSSQKHNLSNEQGSPPAPAQLLSHAERASNVAPIGAASEALDAINRPAHAGRQGAQRQERAETRRAKRGPHGRMERDK